MDNDILSDVLRSIRLRGAVYYNVGTSGIWSARSPAGRDIAAAVMPEADHVMEYHVIVRGSCWAAVDGLPPVPLAAGDIILFPRGDAHIVSSARDLPPQPGERPYPPVPHAPFNLLVDGTDRRIGEHCDPDSENRIICGFFGCDMGPFNPLIGSLPRIVHLRAETDSSWAAVFLLRAVEESQRKRPGSLAILERMSEMMFVDALRRHAGTLPDGSHGWLAGLRDRIVGPALALLHKDPAAPWTVEELSRRVGLSRSALHERFAQIVGQPPMQYLACWRIQLAATLLRNSNATMAVIAAEVGYDSEAAFSRAFRRLAGAPPARWRRAMQQRVHDAQQAAANALRHANAACEEDSTGHASAAP